MSPGRYAASERVARHGQTASPTFTNPFTKSGAGLRFHASLSGLGSYISCDTFVLLAGGLRDLVARRVQAGERWLHVARLPGCAGSCVQLAIGPTEPARRCSEPVADRQWRLFRAGEG